MNDFQFYTVVGKRYRLVLKPTGDHSKGNGLVWIQRLAEKFCIGRGLDIGPAGCIEEGQFAPFPGATPVDLRIPGSGSFTNLRQYEAGGYDYVISSHCLEHVNDPEKAFKEVHRVLKPGGIFFLFLPYPDHPAWDPNTNPHVLLHHPWQPTPTAIGRLMLFFDFEVVYLEHNVDILHSFCAIGRKK